ncbi:MAG: ABC transporter permease subunit [Spirochaetes bacterium]|nr:ABC transporter permease subunit [Spirochaetota bacterium]
MTIGELTFSFLKRNWKVSFVVTAGMALITVLLVSMFPDMPSENALAVADSWPRIMKDLFGDPLYSFTDIYGWLYLQVFHITYWIAYGVLASILAASIVAKEIEGNTIDILLSYPITRSGLIFGRMIAVIMIVSAATVFTLLVCILGIVIAGFPIYLKLLVPVFLVGLVISLVFASLSLFISVCTSRQTLSVFFTLGIIGFFFIYEEVLAKLYRFLDTVSFLNPFHYYKPESILIRHSFSIVNTFVLLLFFLIFLIGSLLYFERKDII